MLNISGVGFGEDWEDWAQQPCFISFSPITDHFCVLCPKISICRSGNTSFQQCLWFGSCQRGTNISCHRKENRNPSIFTLFFPFYILLSFTRLNFSVLMQNCRWIISKDLLKSVAPIEPRSPVLPIWRCVADWHLLFGVNKPGRIKVFYIWEEKVTITVSFQSVQYEAVRQ